RKAHLLEDKQISSVGVFDEVFSTWMEFGGNTRDLGSFGEETDKITDLHQILKEVLLVSHGDGVVGIMRHRRDPSGDDVRDLVTASRRSRLNEDLGSSTVEEGKFLGHMVTKEGVGVDPEKVQAIIRSPTPKSPSQIRILFLQLTTISKFILKLLKLKYPINKVRMRMDVATGSGWTNVAEEALQRIKRKLEKLQTLVILKEGEKKHKVAVTTDGPMEEIRMLSGGEGRLAKWAAGIQTYEIFKSNPNTKCLEVIPGKEIIKEGSGVGIILVSPDEKMHSYAIRLKFNASDRAMDYEALLAGLVAYVNKSMKDLYAFIDSLTLVSQIEENHTPIMKQERKYKEEIKDATAPFHMLQITHLPIILNSKEETLTGLETIKLEFLN
nr:hypothetical protein [Tanacetum cinerariifolium]